jgi:alpha-beta hydrolase superfamily lysophospholipase
MPTDQVESETPEINRLLFPPRQISTEPSATGQAAGEQVLVDVGLEFSLRCSFYRSAEDAPNIVFFPTTGEPQEDYQAMAERYNRHGINIILVCYRTDSNSEATQTIASFLDDGQQILVQLSEWLRANGYSGQLFPMGQSLGSSLVIDIVTKNSEMVGGMLLEGVIPELNSFLAGQGVSVADASANQADAFNNLQKIESISLPTLIFHGARDQLIATAQAEKLQAASGARTKQFFVIPGAGHLGLSNTGGDLYFQTIKNFLDTVCGVNTWRQRRRKQKNT